MRLDSKGLSRGEIERRRGGGTGKKKETTNHLHAGAMTDLTHLLQYRIKGNTIVTNCLLLVVSAWQALVIRFKSHP
ncbi:hypothetical protein Pmani_035856 [Petrolisthes manimaculis]|uniref:Uncharacterized protein n=1 Tax=Petrolisthes manimaculis TaxID=1843537 RepID=A0AAE1NLJ3_9EUCA|nr:hypothetical protein Pmani_035856 [Petrolisthes manimaculis]